MRSWRCAPMVCLWQPAPNSERSASRPRRQRGRGLTSAAWFSSVGPTAPPIVERLAAPRRRGGTVISRYPSAELAALPPRAQMISPPEPPLEITECEEPETSPARLEVALRTLARFMIRAHEAPGDRVANTP